MRLIGAPLLEAFPNAILNVHPSLLPAFPGVDAQRQALEHGVKVAGATVHLVTGELDGGPDRAAGRGPGARRRHGGDAVRAHPRSRSTGSIPKPCASCSTAAGRSTAGASSAARRRSTRRPESTGSARASCSPGSRRGCAQERVLEHHAAQIISAIARAPMPKPSHEPSARPLNGIAGSCPRSPG